MYHLFIGEIVIGRVLGRLGLVAILKHPEGIAANGGVEHVDPAGALAAAVHSVPQGGQGAVPHPQLLDVDGVRVEKLDVHHLAGGVVVVGVRVVAGGALLQLVLPAQLPHPVPEIGVEEFLGGVVALMVLDVHVAENEFGLRLVAEDVGRQNGTRYPRYLLGTVVQIVELEIQEAGLLPGVVQRVVVHVQGAGGVCADLHVGKTKLHLVGNANHIARVAQL